MEALDPVLLGWLEKVGKELGGPASGGNHPLDGLSLEGARIGAFLGAGSFAAVFDLHDPMSEAPLAVKVLERKGGDEAARDDEIFRREVDIGRQLDHPSVTRIHRYLEMAGSRFVVMDKIQGHTLSQEERPLSIQRYRDIFGPLADGLAYAHQLGVVHRDLKPENVMLDRGQAVKVLDFGMARQTGNTNVTMTGQFKGTPMYCAPEQVLDSKSVSAACDQFSFGLLTFEMLSGAFPYPTDPKQPFLTLFSRLQQPADRLASVRPDLGEAVDQAVAKMLAQQPGDRFSSVTEAFAAVSAGLP